MRGGARHHARYRHALTSSAPRRASRRRAQSTFCTGADCARGGAAPQRRPGRSASRSPRRRIDLLRGVVTVQSYGGAEVQGDRHQALRSRHRPGQGDRAPRPKPAAPTCISSTGRSARTRSCGPTCSSTRKGRVRRVLLPVHTDRRSGPTVTTSASRNSSASTTPTSAKSATDEHTHGRRSTASNSTIAEAGAGGRPLLLVHGFGGSKEDFTTTCRGSAATRLARRRARPARARRQRAPEERGRLLADDLADDLHALLDALGWRHATVLGHSMGGMVVQLFALAHPERARRARADGHEPQDARPRRSRHDRRRPSVVRDGGTELLVEIGRGVDRARPARHARRTSRCRRPTRRTRRGREHKTLALRGCRRGRRSPATSPSQADRLD